MPFILSILTLGMLQGAVPEIPVTSHQLDNGLQVIFSEDHRLPVVSVEVRYLVGSAHEKEGRTGFAHLFEHLMFQGSANFDNEYFKPLEPIGARVNGTTNTDRTNYYEQVPSEYLERVLWLESDRMENLLPVLTQAKLDNQRDVVKNERRQNYEDRPYGMAFKHLVNNIFPKGHPYHHLPIGSHADLTAASLDDVRAFFKRYYCPANAMVTVVGDFNSADTLALVTRYFGTIKGGVRAKTPNPEPVSLRAAVHVKDVDEVPLPRVYFAWPSPALFADGDAGLDILASVLTDGKASRLYQELVYEKRIAKSVAAYQVSKHLAGFFVVQATAAPGKSIEDLAEALQTALGRALATPPTKDEFERSLNGWKKSFFGRIESGLRKVQLLSGYAHMAGEPGYLSKDLKRYTSLSVEDVHKTGTRWLNIKTGVRVDIAPKPEDNKARPSAVPKGGK
jgi:zinc protease